MSDFNQLVASQVAAMTRADDTQTAVATRDTDIAVTTEAATSKIGLFDIAQELRDIIFDYAYPQVPRLRLIDRKSWEEREYENRVYDDHYQTQPFPGYKVEEFLVSKQYYQAAVKTWVGNQWIKYDHVVDLLPPTLSQNEQVLFKYTTNLIIDGMYYGYDSGDFPLLKNVRLKIATHDFKELAPRFPWEAFLDDEEIKSTEVYKSTIELRDLKSIEVLPAKHDSAIESRGRREHTKRKDVWLENLKQFQELVQVEVVKPKAPPPPKRPAWMDQERSRYMGMPELPHVEEDQDLMDFVLAASDVKRAELSLSARVRAVEAEEKSTLVLRDTDIPDSNEAIVELLAQNPTAVFEWMKKAKKAMSAAAQVKGNATSVFADKEVDEAKDEDAMMWDPVE